MSSRDMAIAMGAIWDYWRRHPRLRLGRVIWGICGGRGPYHVPDEEIVRLAENSY